LTMSLRCRTLSAIPARTRGRNSRRLVVGAGSGARGCIPFGVRRGG
jgi:hypothetical protein